MYGKSIDRIPPDFRRKFSRQPVKRSSECSGHLSRYGHTFLFRNIDKRPASVVQRAVRKIRHMFRSAERPATFFLLVRIADWHTAVR